jgi:hypothetical protein
MRRKYENISVATIALAGLVVTWGLLSQLAIMAVKKAFK